jgi:hypothetical protein
MAALKEKILKWSRSMFLAYLVIAGALCFSNTMLRITESILSPCMVKEHQGVVLILSLAAYTFLFIVTFFKQ